MYVLPFDFAFFSAAVLCSTTKKSSIYSKGSRLLNFKYKHTSIDAVWANRTKKFPSLEAFTVK